MNALSYRDFLLRLLTVALVVVLLVAFWLGSDVILLVFLAGLLATLLRSAGKALSGCTRLSAKWAVVVSLAILVLSALLVGFFGMRVAEEAQGFAQRFPEALRDLQGRVEGLPFGGALWERLPLPDGNNVNGNNGGEANGVMNNVGENNDNDANGVMAALPDLTALANAVVYFVFVLFGAFFFAFDPDLYKGGLVKLVPQEKRGRAKEVLDTVIATLRAWFLGRLISMAAVAVMVTLGLWLLDMPFALLLGLIAGLLDFIPYAGPFIAAVPAVVIAFAEDPMQGIYVALFYYVVQNIESYAITPFALQWAVHLPPVLTLAIVLLMYTLFGLVGLLVATPLTAALMVLVKMLYIEDVLGDEVDIQVAKGNS